MTYQVKNEDHQIVGIFYTEQECFDHFGVHLEAMDYYIRKIIPCRACESEGEEQYDSYGISTGYWCNPCYNSDKYPYRKDRYPTIENHGYGERLDDNY